MTDLKDMKSLDQRIGDLEKQIDGEKIAFREQFHELKESLKPGNIIKDAFKEVSQSEDLKSHIANFAITIAAGALSRKIMVGSSTNLIRKVLGSVVQFGVSSLVSRKADTIKNAGSNLLGNLITSFRNRKRKHDEDDEEKEVYEYNMF